MYYIIYEDFKIKKKNDTKYFQSRVIETWSSGIAGSRPCLGSFYNLIFFSFLRFRKICYVSPPLFARECNYIQRHSDDLCLHE